MTGPPLRFLGRGLNRPECVLAHSSGLLFVPDWTGRGGVSVVSPSGRVRRILSRGREVRPNGIALLPGGDFLLAHLGETDGGVWRLSPDGDLEPFVLKADGADLPPTNFVLAERPDRVWITVSTRVAPRAADYRPDASTGFVALWDGARAGIVADGLGYANECAISADGATLWVNETFGRRTTAFDVAEDGALSNRRVVLEHGPGTFPDGLALDEEGGLWITSIVSNRVIHARGGEARVVVEDVEPEHLAEVEAAYSARAMGRPHLDAARSRALRNISSLAFAGPDLRTAVLGCLLGDRLALFDAGVAGQPPPHWRRDLGPLARFLED